jgi:putative transposase
MNVLKPMPEMPDAGDRRVAQIGHDTALPSPIAPGAGRKTFRMFLVATLLVGGGVAFGMWRHSLGEAEVNATSEQRRSIVPTVRVTTVRANDGMMAALLPASTHAFESAVTCLPVFGPLIAGKFQFSGECDSGRRTRKDPEEIEVHGGADRLRPAPRDEGPAIGEVGRRAGISEATYYNWRKKYGGLLPSEMKRLRQLEEENGKLKKIVADLSLDKEMLQDVIRRKL